MRSLACVIIVVLIFLPRVDGLFAEFNWRQFEGVELNILLIQHPWQEAIEPLIPEFEKETGIKTHVSVYPAEWFRAKRSVEMAARVTEIDVTMLIMAREGKKYKKSGWIMPLEELLLNPNVTNPHYSPEDFFKGAWESSQVDGTQVGIPITLEVQPMLFYRKDLLKKYKVSVPKTLEELAAAAKSLTRDTNGNGRVDLYGITMRGEKAAATSVWAAFLHGYGGTWKDAENGPAIDSPEAIAAFEMYGKLLRESGPPDSETYNWYEVVSLMSQGNAAFACDASLFSTTFEDKRKSMIAGKVGYSIMPAGPKGSIPGAVVWSLVIPHLSKNDSAAWLFIQWATSKEIVLKLLKKRITGGRISSWENPETAKLYPKDFIEAFIKSAESASAQWYPPFNDGANVREIIGEVIVDAVKGVDVAQSARNASEQIENSITPQ